MTKFDYSSNKVYFRSGREVLLRLLYPRRNIPQTRVRNISCQHSSSPFSLVKTFSVENANSSYSLLKCHLKNELNEFNALNVIHIGYKFTIECSMFTIEL